MSYLLDAVREGRELRDAALTQFHTAIVRAKRQHSLREVGDAAGLGRMRISQIVNQHKREESRDV